tara:strand:+ start:126 stop:581 length:456 start_codon:yes stop_codon:yes gene_type:complete
MVGRWLVKESNMIEEIESLVSQLSEAEKSKVVIEDTIASLKNKILQTKHASTYLNPLSNTGGSKTSDGLTYSIPKKVEWDQADLDLILESIPRADWPPFVTQLTSYKVDNSAWKSWAIENPTMAFKFNRARSVAFGKKTVARSKSKTNKED